jgi:hypothetical protein
VCVIWNSNLFLTILFVNPTPVTLELRFNSIPFVLRSHRACTSTYRRRLAGISIYFVRYRSGPFLEFFLFAAIEHRTVILLFFLPTINCTHYFFLCSLIVNIYCTRGSNLIKFVNWDTCVSFRVSAPEYRRIRILPKHQCRRILAPLSPCLSGLANSFAYPAQD